MLTQKSITKKEEDKMRHMPVDLEENNESILRSATLENENLIFSRLYFRTFFLGAWIQNMSVF